jgi:apolipoprotein N-acyltransferase
MAAGSPEIAPAPPPAAVQRRRSWLDVRWRQFRNAPRPVVRAVGSSLAVALVLGAAYLAYDLTAPPADAPGRTLAGVLYVFGVLVAGSFITWLVVPLPRGSGSRAVRTPWSAMLGLFAAIPIAYLVLIVAFQVIKPLIV